ncbi:MAG TPA: hypothetical protein VGM44_17980 [Polyangiaceae bacterium]
MRVFSQLWCALALSSCAGVLCFSPRAAAADVDADSNRAEPESHEPRGYERYRTPIRSGPDYWHTFGSLSFGDGLRFNNPYRLSTELGSGAESLSLTASYFDIGIGAVRGSLDGIGHGAVLHLSIAAQGIPQEVLSLSYIALDRLGSGRTMLYARAGVPVILQPDLSGGLEAAFGGAFMITSGIGIEGELIGDVYYGAATLDHSVSTIPILSAQLGVFFDYEVLK